MQDSVSRTAQCIHNGNGILKSLKERREREERGKDKERGLELVSYFILLFLSLFV